MPYALTPKLMGGHDAVESHRATLRCFVALVETQRRWKPRRRVRWGPEFVKKHRGGFAGNKFIWEDEGWLLTIEQTLAHQSKICSNVRSHPSSSQMNLFPAKPPRWFLRKFSFFVSLAIFYD
jgi:hypothetical protein